jgi:hypothetical protein
MSSAEKFWRKYRKRCEKDWSSWFRISAGFALVLVFTASLCGLAIHSMGSLLTSENAHAKSYEPAKSARPYSH